MNNVFSVMLYWKEVVIKVGKEIENLKQELKDGYDKLDQKAQSVLHDQKAKMNLWIK